MEKIIIQLPNNVMILNVEAKEKDLDIVNWYNTRKEKCKIAKIGRIKTFIDIADVLELKSKRSLKAGLFLNGEA